MASTATMKPKSYYTKCRNCGFGTKKLHELDTPIKNKTVLPIYAVCKSCYEVINDRSKKEQTQRKQTAAL